MDLIRSLATLFGGAFVGGAVLAWLFRQRPQRLSVAAIVILATWPLWTMLSQATTCTMGDTDSWATTLGLCSLLAGLAMPLLAASGDVWRPHRAWVPILTLVPLLFFVSHATETGLGTHHLCGPEYDAHFGGSLALARIFYPLMWIYGLFLTALALRPLLRQSPSSLPR